MISAVTAQPQESQQLYRWEYVKPRLVYFAEGILDELLRVLKQLGLAQLTPAIRLHDHHQQILEYIDQHGFITDKDYAGLTDRAKATRTADFNKLIDLGLVERQGRGRSTHYRRPKA